MAKALSSRMARAKFKGVDFDSIAPVLLADMAQEPGVGFRCVRGEFVSFWRGGRVWRDVSCSVSQCWVLRTGEGLAAYVTLMADALKVDGLLRGEGVGYKTFPAVKIGMLAADTRAKGAGTALVWWALEYVVTQIVPRIGARFLTVDALYDPDNGYDSSPFYHRFGFLLADPNGSDHTKVGYRTMFLDLKPFVDALR